MKILLLSAYDADSHQYWRKGLVAQLPEHQWTVLTLPGRYFSWRIRGNSMSWAFGKDAALLHAEYDLVIATSMTDLSALKGFVPSLANTATLLYFHENQFAYPATGKARANVEPQILNLYSALAAQKIAFNSHYNYQTFMQGVDALLQKLPDQIPANVVTLLKQKSSVLPVPLSGSNMTLVATLWSQYADVSLEHRPLLITWAARWEYDKGPDRLLAIVQLLETQGIDYRLCIMGQSFRQIPEPFTQLQQQFAHRIDQFGYADTPAQYQSWLRDSDLFISTAQHEFQGLSVLEAAAQGCIPILPDRLVYPELFAAHFLYASHQQASQEAESAVALILKFKHSELQNEQLADIDYSWDKLATQYRVLINECAQCDD
ncbi:MAG: DUF3524 domain-containing protein [Oceanospirillaceae bacterium]